jgi:hypothetical protein
LTDQIVHYNVEIYLTAHRHKSTWATETRLKNGRRTRTAGRLPNATADSLQVIGLIAAMKSLSQNQLREISRHREHKPRLRVVSQDARFVDALRALINNKGPTSAERPLRSGRNFTQQLLKQLRRFDITIEADPGDKTYAFQALNNWVQTHVHKPAQRLPAFLQPVAVSES